MTNNEFLRKISDIFDLDATQILNFFAQSRTPHTRAHVEGLLAKKNRNNFQECSNADLLRFLEGFIVSKRGPTEAIGKDIEESTLEINNNLLLKKLRVALKLYEKDVSELFKLGGEELSRNELTALFRNDQHKHYKPCPNKLFLAFMTGLKKHYQKDASTPAT